MAANLTDALDALKESAGALLGASAAGSANADAPAANEAAVSACLAEVAAREGELHALRGQYAEALAHADAERLLELRRRIDDLPTLIAMAELRRWRAGMALVAAQLPAARQAEDEAAELPERLGRKIFPHWPARVGVDLAKPEVLSSAAVCEFNAAIARVESLRAARQGLERRLSEARERAGAIVVRHTLR
jgi:hypothetical protein